MSNPTYFHIKARQGELFRRVADRGAPVGHNKAFVSELVSESIEHLLVGTTTCVVQGPVGTHYGTDSNLEKILCKYMTDSNDVFLSKTI